MSYEIAKSLSVGKKMTTMVSRSNNVWPAHYIKSTFPNNNAELLREFDSGCIQPLDSANGYKWWYIMEVLHKSGLEGEERLKRFEELIAEKEPSGKFCVKTDKGYVEKFVRSRWFRTYIADRVKQYNFYQANYIASRLSFVGANVEKC